MFMWRHYNVKYAADIYLRNDNRFFSQFHCLDKLVGFMMESIVHRAMHLSILLNASAIEKFCVRTQSHIASEGVGLQTS